MSGKKLSDMTPVERIDKVLKDVTWDGAEEAGIEILARCVAFHCYVKDDGEEYYKRIMLSIAERSADWAKEHSTCLALAKVGSKMKNYGNN